MFLSFIFAKAHDVFASSYGDVSMMIRINADDIEFIKGM